MKILSYNVRGAGRRAKRREFKELVNRLKIDFGCIQESKLDNIERRIGRSLWGGKNFDWAFELAEGNAGGIISIWNKDRFQKISSWNTKNMVVVNGIWIEKGNRCTIVNVYAPSVPTARWDLWD